MRLPQDRPQHVWLGLCAVLLLLGCDPPESTVAPKTRRPAQLSESQSLEFVGSSQCIRCHPGEAQRWLGSDHDRAMEAPSSESVVGRFDGSILRRFEHSWRFVREGDEFQVELQESDRPVERLRVDFTFGHDPLQQYLVSRADGRIQALPVAWDDRSEDVGGQRWIDLQAGERIAPDDPLHWERLAYNWNSQCAACHSTHLSKGYDPATDRFDTRWADLDVGCEGCHGPGSRHVVIFDEKRSVPAGVTGLEVSFERWNPEAWRRREDDKIASRVIARTHDAQLDVCGPCHSRRTQIVDVPKIGAALLDGHRPRLIDPGLYFEDGQIQDEVYVWGSFLQSRMHAAGVRCNDCHDPHSLGLRREGNALCAGCHDAASYDGKAHHGHESGSAGSSCVECHMPSRVYMEVDARRDHSFPIPRPDRSASLQVPNACENCHAERDSSWAAGQIQAWRSPDSIRPPHWSDHLVEGGRRRSDPARWIEIALDARSPAIVRASAWSRYAAEAMGQVGSPPTEILREQFRAAGDLERLALIDVARRMPPALRASVLRPLLEDERLAIRVSAAEALADVPASVLRPADRAILTRALREHRESLEVNAERPDAQVGLGLLSLHYGELDAAREHYQRALELAPYFVPAYANLADLERMVGRDEEAIGWLRRGVELAPDDVLVRHALGLALHRTGSLIEGLGELERAAQSAPDQPRLVLAWALALDAAARRGEAIEVLEAAAGRGAGSDDVLHALVTLLRDAGERLRAKHWAERWLRSSAADPRPRALLEELGRDPRKG